ncbi:MAG: murein biosynthesis integral membrane protein MurJ [bacterium]
MPMRIRNILHIETQNTTTAAFVVAVSFGVSALLGLIRDRLLASRFGADKNLDVYFTAFRIPDFVYGLVVVGGLTAALLPVLSEYLQKEEYGEDRQTVIWSNGGQLMVNNVLACFSLILLAFCGLLFILTPLIIRLIAPGFSADQILTTIALTRFMFLSPLILGISNLVSGVLQYSNRFLSYSLAPLFYNFGIILGILFFVPTVGLIGLAWGVVFGASLHLLIQMPAFLSSGFRFKPILRFNHPGLLKIFKMMIPRIIGQASYHFNLIFITAIASTMVSGSIAIFNFSNNLQWFPVGMIGVSFAVAAFPDLSRFWANGRYDEFIEKITSSLKQILFLIIPISVGTLLLRAQIVRLILGTGRFGWTETRLTAASLGIFAFGIIAASAVPLITRAFFSLKDTRTPVIVAISSTAINLFLSILLVRIFTAGIDGLVSNDKFVSLVATLFRVNGLGHIEVLALPIALFVSSVFQALMLWILLTMKIKKISDPVDVIWQNAVGSLKICLTKIVISATIMSIVVYLSLAIVGRFVDMQTFGGVLLQSLTGGLLGLLAYLFVAYLLNRRSYQ